MVILAFFPTGLFDSIGMEFLPIITVSCDLENRMITIAVVHDNFPFLKLLEISKKSS
jgi:hypothetical protein